MSLGRRRVKLGVSLATAVLCLGFVSGCKKEAPVDPLAGYRVAIVDLPPLMELHPDYPKLEQLSKEIDELHAKKMKMQNEARDSIVAAGGDEIEQAIEKAKAKLQAEQAQVEGELSSLQSSLQAQVQAEMRGIQADMEGELKDIVSKLMPPSQKEEVEKPPVLDSKVDEQQIQDYLQNLHLVRERNLAAKRLELQKRVSDEVVAKKADVDGQLSAFEADLSAKYQTERLNLQLTAQNSTDEEAKTAAENRLGEISSEIDSARSAKRAELEGVFAAVSSEKSAQLQSELEAYRRELDAEVAANMDQKRRELGGAAVPAPRPAQTAEAPTGPPPEVKQKIAELESRMRAQVASKQAEVEARMKAKIADSQGQLEAKRTEIQESLKKLTEEIQTRITEGLANLPEELKAKFDEIDEKMAKMEDEREKLIDGMRQDISTQVASVAEKKSEKMVLGLTYERNYFYKDPSFEDLTDLTSVKLQTAEKK